MSAAFPTTGRIAGIDFGTVRIGVALTDAGRVLSSPHDNYTRRDELADRRYFQELARQEDLVGFVVGLPVHLSGDESEKSLEARRFGKWLAQITGLPVRYYDERFSSRQADLIMGMANTTRKKKKKSRDKLAAQILLAAFLESGGQDDATHALDD